jgi:hypothetical protein
MSDTVIIPHPDNPQHVENLCNLELLEAQGFEGSDVSLEVSLFEYDLIWRKLPPEQQNGEGDYLFVYHCGHGKFARAMREEKKFASDFSWMHESDWGSLCAMHGTGFDEWLELPYPARIGDLLTSYGYMNVFASNPHTFAIPDPMYE